MLERQSWLGSLAAASVISLLCLGAFKAGQLHGHDAGVEEAQESLGGVPGLRTLDPSLTDAEIEQNARESLSGMHREFLRVCRRLGESQIEIERLREQLAAVRLPNNNLQARSNPPAGQSETR